MNQEFWSYYGVDSYGRPTPAGQPGAGGGTSYVPDPSNPGGQIQTNPHSYKPDGNNDITGNANDTPVSQAGGQANAPAAPHEAMKAPPVYPTYQATQLPRYSLPTYQAGAIPQFQAPGNGDTEALQKQYVNRLLTSPETFSPELVDTLRAGVQKDATDLADQQRAQVQGSAASRNVGTTGYVDALLQQIGQGTNANIVQGRSNILVEKAKQDAADRAQAQQIAESFLNGSAGRAQGNYASTLTGSLAQEGANKDQIASLVQQILFNQNQDLSQLDENRFAFGTQADAAKFGEGQRQFNENLGFNYTQLTAQQQADLIRQILGA